MLKLSLRGLSIGLGFILFSLFIIHVLYPINTEVEYSKVILAMDGTPLHAYLTSDDKWRLHTSIEEITPELEKAIIYKEDRYFYYHFGFNPIAILRAAFKNTTQSRRTSGASTITMQVCRLLAPKERTYWHKLVELFRAMQLELKLSKREILQLYLNLIPYGSNVEGVKSAAMIYFEKMPDNLSLAEVTVLSIVPNRPSSLRLGGDNEYLRTQRDQWLKKFEAGGLFDKNAIRDALSESLSTQRHEMPKLAPHLSARLLAESGDQPTISTHLDLNIQLKTETLVKQYVQGLYAHGIKNAAVLVVDNATSKVISYVGSADYTSDIDGGQVDGIRAVRSPGSTLKPFLYGLAIDKGLVTPRRMLEDVAVNFSGYQPENYNEQYNGKITMADALAKSLNIPAVKVLNELTPNYFIEKLSEAGFRAIEKNKDKLGLSVILGGCGVTLEELVQLYLSQANGGELRKLSYTRYDTLQPDQRILSKESNYMISEIMTNVVRPDLPDYWRNSANLPKVAWKTGTSYGRRDAWSIGFNKKYTIGVWVGNFSGEGVHELTGSDIAAPLLFKIFNAIDHDTGKEWFFMPKGVGLRHVCAETGLIPNEYCTQEIIDYYLPGVSDYRACDHLQTIYVNPDSTMSYCRTCLPENGYIRKNIPNYSQEIMAYFESEGIEYQKTPPHNPDCERIFQNNAPIITSPVAGIEYLVDKSDSLQMLLKCNVANDVEKVYWYIDNRYYGTIDPRKNLFFTPKDGKVNVSCTDDKGRTSKVGFVVKLVKI